MMCQLVESDITNTHRVEADAGRPRLAMQAQFCDTTAFGRQATEGERAGGKCNDTHAHETGPEEESTSQGRR